MSVIAMRRIALGLIIKSLADLIDENQILPIFDVETRSPSPTGRSGSPVSRSCNCILSPGRAGSASSRRSPSLGGPIPITTRRSPWRRARRWRPGSCKVRRPPEYSGVRRGSNMRRNFTSLVLPPVATIDGLARAQSHRRLVLSILPSERKLFSGTMNPA